MTDLKFMRHLAGDTGPVVTLLNELSNAGVNIECFSSTTIASGRSGDGIAFADWYEDLRLWRVYFLTRVHAHRVYHELLHVRFKAVYGAPIMRASPLVDERKQAGVASLNSDFDHAYVVPREVAQYPKEAEVYWERNFKRRFDVMRHASTSLTDMHRWKFFLNRVWLILPVALPRAAITVRVREELRKGGWLELAQAMSERVQSIGPDKQAAVQAFRDCVGCDFLRAEEVIYL